MKQKKISIAVLLLTQIFSGGEKNLDYNAFSNDSNPAKTIQSTQDYLEYLEQTLNLCSIALQHISNDYVFPNTSFNVEHRNILLDALLIIRISKNKEMNTQLLMFTDLREVSLESFKKAINPKELSTEEAIKYLQNPLIERPKPLFAKLYLDPKAPYYSETDIKFVNFIVHTGYIAFKCLLSEKQHLIALMKNKEISIESLLNAINHLHDTMHEAQHKYNPVHIEQQIIDEASQKLQFEARMLEEEKQLEAELRELSCEDFLKKFDPAELAKRERHHIFLFTKIFAICKDSLDRQTNLQSGEFTKEQANFLLGLLGYIKARYWLISSKDSIEITKPNTILKVNIDPLFYSVQLKKTSISTLSAKNLESIGDIRCKIQFKKSPEFSNPCFAYYVFIGYRMLECLIHSNVRDKFIHCVPNDSELMKETYSCIFALLKTLNLKSQKKEDLEYLEKAAAERAEKLIEEERQNAKQNQSRADKRPNGKKKIKTTIVKPLLKSTEEKISKDKLTEKENKEEAEARINCFKYVFNQIKPPHQIQKDYDTLRGWDKTANKTYEEQVKQAVSAALCQEVEYLINYPGLTRSRSSPEILLKK